jgi:PAS domain S-box-containing protein
MLSEHQRAEESLRQNEEKFRWLFEESRDAIVIDNPAGEFIDFNQSALELSGYTREEMERLSTRELYAEPSSMTASGRRSRPKTRYETLS